MQPIYLVLHNIRSTYNVGAIVRTADGVGVEKVYLCGHTPAPTDRFGRKRKDIAKTALGAEDAVVWEHREDVATLIKELQSRGVQVIAIEQHKDSVPYTELSGHTPVALLVGPEVMGIEEEVLALCDRIAEIPMHGTKESLNVSVAAGVVLYWLATQPK